MSQPSITQDPELETSDGSSSQGEWAVTVFNNEKNTWDEVMDILMLATACTEEEAYIETWEIDKLGKSTVHYAAREECEQVAEIIAQIGIEVKVSHE